MGRRSRSFPSCADLAPVLLGLAELDEAVAGSSSFHFTLADVWVTSVVLTSRITGLVRSPVFGGLLLGDARRGRDRSAVWARFTLTLSKRTMAVGLAARRVTMARRPTRPVPPMSAPTSLRTSCHAAGSLSPLGQALTRSWVGSVLMAWARTVTFWPAL